MQNKIKIKNNIMSTK